MSDRVDVQELPSEPAARTYAFVCLASLVVILLMLLKRGLGAWSFLPVLISVLGVTLRWRVAPLLTLVLLAGFLYVKEMIDEAVPGSKLYQHAPFSLPDWILSGAVLAYCAAHYRLQGLTFSIFPPDSRRGQEAGEPSAGTQHGLPGYVHQQRSTRSVSPWEVSWLILSLPIWAFLAQLSWKLLPGDVSKYGISSRAWQGIVLTWIVGLGILLTASFLHYAGRQRMTRREARLFLQDLFWRETSRDQRRLNRWLAWARLRRRKEKP